DKTAEEGNRAEFIAEFVVDDAAGEGGDVVVEIDGIQFFAEKVLAEDFPLDDFGGFAGDFFLAFGDQALPAQAEEADRISGTEKHADRDPIRHPADERA